jgi:hypothetical protein
MVIAVSGSAPLRENRKSADGDAEPRFKAK